MPVRLAYSTSAAGDLHVSSTHKVRAYVSGYGKDLTYWDVARVKLTYVYGILH